MRPIFRHHRPIDSDFTQDEKLKFVDIFARLLTPTVVNRCSNSDLSTGYEEQDESSMENVSSHEHAQELSTTEVVRPTTLPGASRSRSWSSSMRAAEMALSLAITTLQKERTFVAAQKLLSEVKKAAQALRQCTESNNTPSSLLGWIQSGKWVFSAWAVTLSEDDFFDIDDMPEYLDMQDELEMMIATVSANEEMQKRLLVPRQQNRLDPTDEVKKNTKTKAQHEAKIMETLLKAWAANTKDKRTKKALNSLIDAASRPGREFLLTLLITKILWPQEIREYKGQEIREFKENVDLTVTDMLNENLSPSVANLVIDKISAVAKSIIVKLPTSLPDGWRKSWAWILKVLTPGGVDTKAVEELVTALKLRSRWKERILNLLFRSCLVDCLR